MTRVPTLPDVAAAAVRMADGLRRTPVLALDRADTGLDATVVLKLELTQHSGSFKARGALNSVLSLPTGTAGVCAASGGNHAGAVSWAAARAGLTADVFVPSNATPAKIARIAEYGGRAHLVDGFVKDALDACLSFAEAHDLPLIHPYDSFETVCGAGTAGLEIAGQVPAADLVVVACGGGGLYAGLTAALDRPGGGAAGRTGALPGAVVGDCGRRTGSDDGGRRGLGLLGRPAHRRDRVRDGAAQRCGFGPRQRAGDRRRTAVPLGDGPSARRAGRVRRAGIGADGSCRRTPDGTALVMISGGNNDSLPD
ncbi:MAG: pyridoxal-phosphate dependent enzyme [Nocardioidaceae bacterium]